MAGAEQEEVEPLPKSRREMFVQSLFTGGGATGMAVLVYAVGRYGLDEAAALTLLAIVLVVVLWGVQSVVAYRREKDFEETFEELDRTLEDLDRILNEEAHLEGLTLYFDARLTPLDRRLIEQVITATLEVDTDCRITLFEERERSTLIHLEANAHADLVAVAEALHQRLWEDEARRRHEGQAALVQAQETAHRLSVILNDALREKLSASRDHLERMELRGSDPTEATRVWSRRQDLQRLLEELFPSADALRRFFRETDLLQHLVRELPGGNASLAQVSDAVVEALGARGLLGGAFFEALVEARPGRSQDILRSAREHRAAA